MSTLQEVLAVLLGAESEAKRIVGESTNDCENYLRSVQDKFAGQRVNEMAAVREQAKSIMDTSLNAAKTESEQITAMGKDERDRMHRRYDENADAVINSMISEIAENLISKGRARD